MIYFSFQNVSPLHVQYLLQIVKDAEYTGFIGVEYEGDRLDEPAGIKATKDLLLIAAKKIK